MSAHSRFSPSSYNRWKNCPGSLNLIEAHPELQSSSSYAEEGTRLHRLAEIWLKEGKEPVSAQDQEKLSPYINHIAMLQVQSPKHVLSIEVKLDLEKVHPGMFGTADAVFMDLENMILHVIDLKMGAGIPVEVKGNTQLRIYALGALLAFPEFKPKEVRSTVVQPLCYHPDGMIRSDQFPVIELIDFWEEVSDAAKKTTLEDAKRNPGNHCRFCPPASICPELTESVTTSVRDSFSVLPNGNSALGLTDALELLPRIEAWAKAIRDHAYNEAIAGRPPRGYKLVEKRARRSWSNEKTLPERLEKEFGLSPLEFWEKNLKSPAQIEKLLSPVDRKRISLLVKSESSGCALVPETDKRPAVIQLETTSFTEITDETGETDAN